MKTIFQICLSIWPLIVLGISLVYWAKKDLREKYKIDYPSLLWWSYTLISWFPMGLVYFVLPQLDESFYFLLGLNVFVSSILIALEIYLHIKGKLDQLRLRAVVRIIGALTVIVSLRFIVRQDLDLSISDLFASFYLIAVVCSLAVDAYFLHTTYNHIDFEPGYNRYAWYSPLVTHRYGLEKLKLIGSYFLVFHLFAQLFFAVII